MNFLNGPLKVCKNQQNALVLVPGLDLDVIG